MKKYILALDRPRRLVFDFDAWEMIAEQFTPDGKKDVDLTNLNITFKDLPIIVCAGLKWEDSELTPEKTKELLNASIRDGRYDFMKILDVVLEAFYFYLGVKNVTIKVDSIPPEELQKNLLKAEDGSGSSGN
jgi:hypothetical protein